MLQTANYLACANTLSNSDSEREMNWKGCGRKLLSNLRYYPGICLEGLRNTSIMDNPSQDIWQRDWNSS
jgi:hypothetical protein